MLKLRNSNTNTALPSVDTFVDTVHSMFTTVLFANCKWENVIITFHASAGPVHNFLNAKLL